MKLIGSLVSVVLFLGVAGWSCQREGDADPFADVRETGEEQSGGSLTTLDLSENAFGNPAPGLNSVESDQFVIGNSFFRTNWTVAPASATARDGLGPLLNANSCGGCHLRDGRGAPPDGTALNGLLLRLSVPGQTPEGAPRPDLNYGSQFSQSSIPGVIPEGESDGWLHRTTGTVRRRDGLLTSPASLPVSGAGLRSHAARRDGVAPRRTATAGSRLAGGHSR